MNRHDAVDQRFIFDIGGTFIVDDDIIILGPVQLAVQRQDGSGR